MVWLSWTGIAAPLAGRSEGEGDPGGVVVAAVAAVAGAAVDEGAGLAGSQGGDQPDLVEQLVAGRLAGFLEAVGPGAQGRRGWDVGLGGTGLDRLGQAVD